MKASYLRKIIKEEIRKVLKETIGQSDKVKREFPDVITYDRQQKMSDLVWTVTTTDTWESDKAASFQEAIGYSPMGYGGPYNFRMLKQEGDKFIYTWTCAASS